MKVVNRSSLLVASGVIVGVALSFVATSFAQTASSQSAPSNQKFLVSIDEITQKFVLGDEFSGSYNHTVKMSDGTTREITLRPMVKDGREVVELTDKSAIHTNHTYMGTNGATTNGKLMISLIVAPKG